LKAKLEGQSQSFHACEERGQHEYVFFKAGLKFTKKAFLINAQNFLLMHLFRQNFLVDFTFSFLFLITGKLREAFLF
jgi:hypothetical protein